MTTLSLSENSLSANVAAPRRRGLARLIGAVSDAFEQVFEVIDEAADQSAAARRRFPTAD